MTGTLEATRTYSTEEVNSILQSLIFDLDIGMGELTELRAYQGEYIKLNDAFNIFLDLRKKIKAEFVE